jgi:hypothetical protein
LWEEFEITIFTGTLKFKLENSIAPAQPKSLIKAVSQQKILVIIPLIITRNRAKISTGAIQMAENI